MRDYKTIALIVAAGSGTRVGGALPKQYRTLNGMPMLRHSVLAFLNHPEIDMVRVVYNENHQHLYYEAVRDLDLLPPIIGGKIRQESVLLGLEAIEEFSPKRVLIHDAARPLVSQKVISRVLNAIEKHKAVIPALHVEDTIKKCSGGKIEYTVNRTDLMRAQTPQGFFYRELLTAHNKVRDQEFSDDASINEHLNIPVHVVPGSQLNFKITTDDDLKRAERLIMRKETRVGIGYDVHSFIEPKKSKDNSIMLCGVEVKHNKSLNGHSDSDVGIHAIVDAILGAISKGDIGEHFPPSDAKYKNMSSSVFLEHARKLVGDADGRILNIDVTLICEEPKISPHKGMMIAELASILKIDVSRVSVKATTTEKLGFTGRKEGIAAQAIANIEL